MLKKVKLQFPSKKTFSSKCLVNRVKLVRDFINKNVVLKGYPTFFNIEPTNRCNLDCIMCPRRFMSRKEIDMPFPLFKSILDQLDAQRTELIVLHSDGEPLLNPDVTDMITYAKQLGFQVMMSTNATLLNTSNANKIIQSGLDILTISLDGMTKSVYESIRKGGDFDKVLENIESFLRLKGRQKPFSIIQMVEQKENSHECDVFLKHWESFENRNSIPVIKPVAEWFEEYPEIIDDMNFCDRVWFGMLIQCDGNVVPCVHDFNGEKVLGTLPQDNIYDLWNSNQMVKFRENLLKSRRLNKICSTCNSTPPKKFNWLTACGLSVLDMESIARALAITGYNRPKQYEG